MATTTETQTVLVHHDPAVEGSIPLAQFENRSLRSQEAASPPVRVSRLQQVVVTIQFCGVTFCSSMVNGLVNVGLPTMTKDLQLPTSLAFWPASVSSLATASTLLLAGSVADAIGPRWVDLLGCLLAGVMTIGAGASKNGQELVAMRALQGVGLALHLASSVSILTQALPAGRGRNMAFSCLGFSQPFGFSFGLVIGGILVDTIGWRSGWYIAGGLTTLLTIVGLWAIPKSREERRFEDIMQDLRTKVDWIGALLASAFMAMLCYLLAILSADVSRIREPTSIVLLCLSAVALPAFITWVHHQVRQSRPALIPNALWKNATFSSICATIALSYGVINSMELFSSLFFQEVQQLPALQASLRILPSLVVGAGVNLAMGFFVHRVSAIWIATVSAVLCAGAPLLMAVAQPSWPYWGNEFVAQLLMPINCDALFTVGLIVITDVFPEDTQALAGAVFNTAGQFGSALGLAILQVISTKVKEEHSSVGEIKATLAGYRASFWAMFAFMIVTAAIGALGLRKTGRVGLKRD